MPSRKTRLPMVVGLLGVLVLWAAALALTL
jgi:hypothetical protein